MYLSRFCSVKRTTLSDTNLRNISFSRMLQNVYIHGRVEITYIAVLLSIEVDENKVWSNVYELCCEKKRKYTEPNHDRNIKTSTRQKNKLHAQGREFLEKEIKHSCLEMTMDPRVVEDDDNLKE